jgi:PAS domain S-box-containing protein
VSQLSAVRVDLHVHSSCSDGSLSPEQLADELAAAGAGFAALADHNTVEGLERFREALERRGVRVISGLELDVQAACGPLHLLAYGFDEHAPRLRRALRAVRHPHWDRLLRAWWPPSLRRAHAPQALALGPGRGALAADEAIRLIHEAGGLVFLAHPLAAMAGPDELERCLDELQGLGLDGIEAHYKPYDSATRLHLEEVARRRGLLASGGSDYHGPGVELGAATPGMDLSEDSWRRLSRALGWTGEGFLLSRAAAGAPARPGWRRGFLLNIGLPAALTGLLFVLAIFRFLLPAMEDQLLERKKEMIRELTRAAVSILQEYEDEARAGRLEPAAARAEAAERLRRLRYGAEGKDYFWVTDMTPRMVMHPWRPDLEGRDLREFQDPTGRRVFVAFVDAVRRRDSGYVDYYWQWKDDAGQIAPKLSHVQAFRPWGWVIGTGIYSEDVQAEIVRVRGRLVYASLLILGVAGLLLATIMRQSLALERRRARAEQELRETSGKYRALVEASTEGTLMVLDGRCAYANGIMERMLGEERGGLAGRGILDLLATDSPGDRRGRETMECLLRGEAVPGSFEARMRRAAGGHAELLLSATSIAADGREGHILVARDISRSKQLAATIQRSRVHYRKLTRSIHMGVFRSAWGDGALLIEANPAMRVLLGMPAEGEPAGVDWLERVVDVEQRRSLKERLQREESAEQPRLALRRLDGGLVEVRLFAVLVREDEQLLCDGVLEDITARARGEAEREELIAQLQTSLFFLQEPVAPAVRPVPVLEAERPISEAAVRMGGSEASALVVVGAGGEPLGLVTDHDFRARVTAVGLDPARPLREIMSAPLASVSVHALVHEAILVMQERGIGHLAVLDEAGRLVGVLRDRHLIHFRHYSTVILTQSIRRAGNAVEIGRARERLPRLVHALLASGARVRAVNRLITGVADAAAERLLALATAELGPPPGAFALLAMGSQGRLEQTLVTDQDNAIVYEEPPPGREAEWQAWFLELGRLVTVGLAEAGYRECAGGVMARHPKWTLSLEAWTAQFRHWIRTADPQQLLDLNIAFDFRCVGGEPALARELRRRVFSEIRIHPPFLLHLAQNALLGRPPLSMGGRIVTQAAGDGHKALDLKEALLPVINHGRLYALRHQVEDTHTLDRLGRLHELGRLSQETWEELLPDYEAAMRMRLEHQARALLEGREADNLLSPSGWTALDEAMLKRLFTVVQDLRRKISYDFQGMA